MTETVVELPAEPAGTVVTYGGFADIARRLNALHPERPIPFSRQLVEKWFRHRETNKFPDRRIVESGGKLKPLFDLDAVERWHVAWMRDRNPGNPPIETIPLFNLDRRGHPIDAEQSSYRGHPADRETRGYRGSVLDL